MKKCGMDMYNTCSNVIYQVWKHFRIFYSARVKCLLCFEIYYYNADTERILYLYSNNLKQIHTLKSGHIYSPIYGEVSMSLHRLRQTIFFFFSYGVDLPNQSSQTPKVGRKLLATMKGINNVHPHSS